jgi:hypothetical protein
MFYCTVLDITEAGRSDTLNRVDANDLRCLRYSFKNANCIINFKTPKASAKGTV